MKMQEYEGVSLRIPLEMLKEFVGGDPHVLRDIDALASEWAVVYKDGDHDALCAIGFDNREDATAWVESAHGDCEIVAALNRGCPVKYSVRVRARIGG